ncbi:MAG: 2-oxoacid:acceptor oxidoreductase subunit alpha [Nitrospirae bacterium]|nr:2-oxoacid:acceptor oxidoreductase subunit alpha [Nitrospirota bacterium]
MAIDLTIKVAGEGGEGVISSGDFIMQAATRAGMEVMTFKSFPAEIKGGYALSQVRISDRKILSQGDGFNILVAFNGEAYEVNKGLLKPGTIMVWDGPHGGDFEPEEHEGVQMFAVPMSDIAKNTLRNYLFKNMVAMGAVIELFGLPEDSLKSSIHDKFIKKGQDIVDSNYQAIELGRQWIRDNYPGRKVAHTFPASAKQKDVIILEGNEAIALGAAMAGARFYGAYPITPATSVGNHLVKLLHHTGGVVYQTEDEISALATVIGASFTGVKALTATSGPGISLMQELIGLAIMSEVPIVIADIQRGGPSTGMPTKHDQSDLFACTLGSHGDAPRIVMAVADVHDCVYLTIDAFNLAETYQSPVMLLSDASLSIQTECIPRPDMSKVTLVERLFATPPAEGEKFNRYQITATGVSPMGAPGIPGTNYAATGLEHSEDSGPRTNTETRNAMTEKRWRKFDNIEDAYTPIEREGEAGDDLGIIAWGMTQAVTREAVARLRAQGHKVSALYPKMLWPLPKKQIEAFAASVRRVVVPEANFQGQFADLIKMRSNVTPIKFNAYRGEPLIPREIENMALELLKTDKAPARVAIR